MAWSKHTSKYLTLILKAFREKAADAGKHINCIALGATRISLKKEKIEIHAWESVG